MKDNKGTKVVMTEKKADKMKKANNKEDRMSKAKGKKENKKKLREILEMMTPSVIALPTCGDGVRTQGLDRYTAMW